MAATTPIGTRALAGQGDPLQPSPLTRDVADLLNSAIRLSPGFIEGLSLFATDHFCYVIPVPFEELRKALDAALPLPGRDPLPDLQRRVGAVNCHSDIHLVR
jgi:hypothetical protein